MIGITNKFLIHNSKLFHQEVGWNGYLAEKDKRMAKKEIPHSRINAIRFFEEYTRLNKSELANKKIFDFSTGSGYIASLFEKAGAEIRIFDLFPEQNQYASARCEYIDLQEKLPLPDECADIVLCCETIECIPDQYKLFQEFARILKPNGILVLTTANPSSLRGRLSQFVLEGEHYSTPIPNEFNAMAKWPGSNRGYFSKVFISGILRLRTLAAINGLEIHNIHKSPRSSTAYLLLPLFFPVIYYFARKAFKKQTRENPENKLAYRQIFEINTSANILLGKHLIIEFKKRFTAA